MPYNLLHRLKQAIPLPWLTAFAALAWLVLIASLHTHLNKTGNDRKVIRLGYMPVITNLAAPILDHATRNGSGIRFKAVKFTSFSVMAESLRNNEIDAAFMIAPLAIVLRQQGEDVKVVCIGNRHESTLVTRKELNIQSFDGLAGRTVAVPLRFSGHNLSLLELMEKNPLAQGIRVVEMNPPDMAQALAAGSLDAYYVGEPFAAQTVTTGQADVLCYVEEVWNRFICNLILVRQDLIESDRHAVFQLVQGAARSGIWAAGHPHETARIASKYWNQEADLIKYAMTTPPNRILYDQFIPSKMEMQEIANRMVQYGLIKNNTIQGLVEPLFARNANLTGVTGISSILAPPEPEKNNRPLTADLEKKRRRPSPLEENSFPKKRSLNQTKENMKPLFKIFLQSIMVFSLGISAMAGETASMVVEHWPPWEIAYDADKENVTGGLAVELAEELFSRLDIRLTLRTVPWKRALLRIEKGQSDLIPMVAQNPERARYMLFTLPIHTTPVLFVYSTDRLKKFEWNRWEDLKPFRIGIIRGYFYGNPWNKAVKEHGLAFEEVTHDTINIRKLLTGRVDLVALFYVGPNMLNDFPGRDKLRFAGKPIHKNILHFGISKKSFLAARLCEINKTIQEMKDDGTFKKILKEMYTED